MRKDNEPKQTQVKAQEDVEELLKLNPDDDGYSDYFKKIGGE